MQSQPKLVQGFGFESRCTHVFFLRVGICSSKFVMLLFRRGLNLNVEVFCNDSGSQAWGEVIISNHNIAVVDKNCHRNHVLIHDVPLSKVIISSRHQHAECGQSTYSCHKAFDELPVN